MGFGQIIENLKRIKKKAGKLAPNHFKKKKKKKIGNQRQPNFIVWLPLLLEILGHMCIEIVFINQIVTSKISKLISSFSSNRFYT